MFSVKRFKIVKDLILSKLDDLLSQVNSLFSLLEKLAELSKASLRTDNSLLKSVIYLIDHQRTVSSESLEQYQHQSNQLANLNQNLSQQFTTLKQQVEALSHIQAEQGRQIEFLANSQAEKTASFLHHAKQELEENTKICSTMLEQMAKRELDIASLGQRIQLLQNATESVNGRQVVVEMDLYSTLNPEVGLMLHLYPHVPGRKVLDIGANVGQVSKCLLDAGYEVYAFEPYPPVFDKMKAALNHRANFHPYRMAVGSHDTALELFVVEELTQERVGEDPSLYNTFRKHPLVEGLEFSQTVNVPVRSLESLHSSAEIPYDISIVKIDTEGFDTEVIRGMGEFKYPVVVTEFWDKNYVFGCEEGRTVADIVQLMQERNYHWYIVIHRQGLSDAAFFCNHPISIDKAWGNIFFFQNYNHFMHAMKWCSATLPTTYFKRSE